MRPAGRQGRGRWVFAGTINDTGTLEVRVTGRCQQHHALARIIHAVEQREDKLPTQQVVDKFAAVYTPVVFAGRGGKPSGALADGLSWMEALYRRPWSGW
ncbi:MAG: hypothetical protein IPK05_19715 [Comamonadaceae bacterium]|nr:hypothetical protein [Comamonadaceae bacterium]